MRNPLGALRRASFAALLALVSVTCTDQPTEPGMGHSARVLFTPSFAGTFAAGLPLDNVTVTVVRPAAETLAVVNTPFAADDSVLQLDLQVDLLAPSEELEVTLELRSGLSILFEGTELILVTSGAAGAAPAIPLAYVGPGAEIASIFVEPRDSALSFGDTLTFSATAADTFESNVANFYLSWSTGTPGIAIRSDGRIIAPNLRATVWIRAVTPTGITDSTLLTFTPVPTQLTKLSGDLQNGAAGDTLPLPLTVLVRAADNLPVKGVAVTFAVTSGGGSVLETVVATDSLGHASAQAILGLAAGANSFSATVAGVGSVSFGATAGAGAPAAIAKQSGDAQSDTVGQVLAPFVARVTDANTNPVAGAAVVWTRLVGTGSLSADTVLTNANGDASVSYTLGAPGTDSISAQLAGTGASVVFSATAVAGGIQVVVVAGDSQSASVTELLPDSLVVETQALGVGTPIGGVAVVWMVQGGNGTLSADTVFSDSLGRAAVTLTLGTVAGEVEVLVDAEQGGPLGVFHLMALPGAPHHLGYGVTPPDTVVSGALVSPAPVIEVRDTFDNVVPVAGVVIHAYTDGMIPATPPVRATAPTLQFAAFLEGTDSAVTDSTGQATFDSLIVTGDVGSEQLHFEELDLGLGEIATPIHLLAGAPSSVLNVAGGGQTVFIDSFVPIQPRVLVTDNYGNPLEGITVDWVVVQGGGQVAGSSVVTDTAGEAEVGSWQMGPAPGTNILRAVVAGVDSVDFQATAIPLTPTIQLTLLNTNVVGVGRTASLQVLLSTPAVGIVTVSVVSNDPSIVDVTPPSVSIPEGSTNGTTTLTGVAAGNAEIVAFAAGYDPDTLIVTGSLNLITLPTAQNVAFGQNGSLPVQLALPAPAGGVVVSVTSLDPTKVSVLTPTVTFLEGEQLKNATLGGVALGTAQIVAENPNFASDTTLATTSAQLNITVTSATQFSGVPQPLTVEFRSGGALIAAPAGGILVGLAARDPACLAPVPSVLIPAGQTNTTFTVAYGGSAALPCTSYVDATAAGIDPDSVNFTLNPPPAATVGNITVGSGLQVNHFLNLATGAHGGVTATVKSLEPATVRLAPNASTAGTDSVQLSISNGSTSAGFYLQGMEGILEDTAFFVVSVPGFVPDTALVVVRRPAYEIAGVNLSATSLTADDAIYVQLGLPNLAGTSIIDYQNIRAGGTPVAADFTIVPGSVAALKDSSGVVDTVRSVFIPVGRYYSSTTRTGDPGGVAVDYLSAGTASVTVDIPGLTPLTVQRTITVTAPGTTLGAPIVGSGLTTSASASLGASAHGGVTTKLKVLTQGIALISPNLATPATDSFEVFLADGATGVSWYVHGLEGIIEDTVDVEFSAPGFIPDTNRVIVRRVGLELASVASSATTLTADDAIYAQMGVLNVAGTAINDYQNIRPGGSPIPVTFTLTGSSVATLKDSAGVTDTVRTALIPVGRYYTSTSRTGDPGGIATDYLGAGGASITVSAPGTTPLSGATQLFTVSAPAITLSPPAVVGSGTQTSGSFSLGASAHGGVTLKVKALSPGLILIAPNTTTVGSDSIDFAVADGNSSGSWYLQGLEGTSNDSVLVEASAPGFVPDTAWVRVRGLGVEIGGLSSTRSTLDANDDFYAQIGVLNVAGTTIADYQNRRFGGSGFTVAFVSQTPTVARLVDAGGPVTDTAFIVVPVGQYYTPTSLASGGVTLDALTTGSTLISVSSPGITSLSGASQTVTVNTPGISVNAPDVGSGLQTSGSFSLGASQHGGVSVVVKSSAPGLILIAPNASTPGSDSIIVNLANGSASGSFYIQGMDGVTGSPSISVSAPGFSDGSDGLTVRQPAIELASVATAPSAGGANDDFYAQIGIPNGTNTAMNDYQNRRAGAAPLTVTFTTSVGAISTLVTSAGSGTTRTVDIVPGIYYTPTSFATGGVSHDPLGAGTTVISAALSGFISLPGAAVTVTIGP